MTKVGGLFSGPKGTAQSVRNSWEAAEVQMWATWELPSPLHEFILNNVDSGAAEYATEVLRTDLAELLTRSLKVSRDWSLGRDLLPDNTAKAMGRGDGPGTTYRDHIMKAAAFIETLVLDENLWTDDWEMFYYVGDLQTTYEEHEKEGASGY